MLFGIESFDTPEDFIKMIEGVDVLCEVNGATAVTFHEIKQRMFSSVGALENYTDEIKLNQDADDIILDFIDNNPTVVALHSVATEDYFPRQAAFNAGDDGIPYVFCEILEILPPS